MGTLSFRPSRVLLVTFGPLVASCALGVGGIGPGDQTSGDGGASMTVSSSADGTTAASGTGSSGAGSTSSAGSSGAGGGPSGSPCPSGLPGPALVQVEGPQGAYCIDSTEVTSADYKKWLDTGPMPSTSGSLPACGWNKTYTPASTGIENCKPEHYDPTGRPTYPVTCVDWCDAYDYCKWAGKRLCGKFGGGPLADFDDYTDPVKSEWMRACSAAGAKKFPYGDTYQAKLCLGDDENDVIGDGSSGEPIPVKSKAGCEGGYPGLFGMSGNAWEWEDACLTAGNPEDDQCRSRGGSFWDDPSYLACGGPTAPQHIRKLTNKNIGIRCCVDAKK